MKILYRYTILMFRFLARFPSFAKIVYKITLKIEPVDRRDRVQGYIFGKIALRQLHNYGFVFQTPKRRGQSLTSRMANKGFAGMGRLSTGRFKPVAGIVTGSIKALPLKEARKSNWLHRIEADAHDTDQPLDMFANDVLSLASLTTRRRTNFSEGFESLKAEAGVERKLDIVMEPGAAVPWSILEELDSQCAVTLHAMNELSDFALIEQRFPKARQKALRDRFNDISPEGVALFEASDAAATTLRRALLDNSDPTQDALVPDDLTEPLDAALSDKISHHLSLYQCIRAALAEIDSPIVICAAPAGYLRAAPQHMTKGLVRKTSWLLLPAGDSEFALDLVARLKETKTPKSNTPAVEDSRAILTAARAEHRSAVLNIRDAARLKIEDYMAAFNRFVSGSPLVLIFTAVGAPAYVKSFSELGRAAIAAFNKSVFPIPVHIDMTRTMPTLSTLCQTTLDDGGLSLDIEAILQIARERTRDASVARTLIRHTDYPDAAPLGLEGEAFMALLERPLTTWLNYQVPQSLILAELGEAFAGVETLAASVISTSRNWHARALATGLRRGDDALPVIDLQTLNILAHPKYRPPVATHMSAVSIGQAKLAHSHFGFDHERIGVTGALQDDALLSQVADVDRPTAYRDLGIPDGARVMTLISQLQPMEDRMLPFAATLADRLDADRRAHLIIRMHPRETQGRLDQYVALFAERGLSDRVSYSRTEGLETVLAVSDVCTTIYSNVAREAAIVGCPVILAGFLGWEPPLRLDHEGFGIWAESRERFAALMSKALDDQASLTGKAHDPDHESSAARLLDLVLELSKNRMTDTSYWQFKAAAAMEPYSEATLVAARGVPLAGLPPLFGRHHSVTTYHPGGNLPVGYLPPTTRFKSGRIDLGDEGVFERATAQANALAETLVDKLLQIFSGETRIGQDLAGMRFGLWLRLRPSLIDRYFQHNLLMSGIENARGALVLAAKEGDELLDLVQAALANGQIDPTDIYVLDPKKGYTVVPLAEFTLPVVSPRPTCVPPDLNWRKPLSRIDIFARTLRNARPGVAEDADVVVTTDWKLKTVPPTIKPLIRNMSADGRRIAVINLSKDHPSLDEIRPLDGVTLLDAEMLYDRIPYLSGTNRKRLASYVAIRMASALVDCPPNVAAEALRVSDALMKNNLRTILCLQAYARFIFGRPGPHISMACPGRQWHADIVHGEADLAEGGYSMTLQNAYMSRGYTYTEPRGQYLSAMDAWSFDVFTETYGVDPAKIDVVSTPRFDYLAELKTRDPVEAKVKLGFDSERRVVMFASQPGPEVENQAVAELFAEFSIDPEINAQFVIKTHPKQPLDRVREFMLWARRAEPAHELRVQRAGDIADFLTASDLALTVFSNVGVEAAVSDTPIIVVNLSGRPLPVPLDEFGFCSTARTKEQLREYILRSLGDPVFQAQEAALRDKFRADNPAMADGTSTKRLMAVIDTHMDGMSMPETVATVEEQVA